MNSWNLTQTDDRAKRSLEKLLKPKYYKVIPKYLILATNQQKNSIANLASAADEARTAQQPRKYRGPPKEKPRPRTKYVAVSPA